MNVQAVDKKINETVCQLRGNRTKKCANDS